MTNSSLASSVPASHMHVQPSGKVSCMDCRQRKQCMPVAMDIKDIDRFDAIIKRSKPIQAGEHVCREGEQVASLFAVRSGSIKTCTIDIDGVDQVTGFFLPGEISGFDAIGSCFSGNDAVAMETTAVCRIPFNKLEELAQKIPGLQHHLFQLMGRQIASDHTLFLNLNKKSALAKIATFLVDLSQRFGIRNCPAIAFRLPMSRTDIGNFLGLRIETVSRIVGSLHRNGVIRIKGRELLIRDYPRLEQLGHSELSSL